MPLNTSFRRSLVSRFFKSTNVLWTILTEYRITPLVSSTKHVLVAFLGSMHNCKNWAQKVIHSVARDWFVCAENTRFKIRYIYCMLSIINTLQYIRSVFFQRCRMRNTRMAITKLALSKNILCLYLLWFHFMTSWLQSAWYKIAV